MNNIVAEKKFISERIKDSAGLPIPYENLSQSYLRAETYLSSFSVVQFSVQKGQVAIPLVTENLLNLNDQFVITHLAIGLRTVPADSPTDLQQLVSQVQTWEDPGVFIGTNSVNVGTVYNGMLNITIDRKEYLPAFPTRAFRRVGATQAKSFLTATGGATATFAANGGANEYPNGLYGFYPMEPTLIDGRQTININIDLKTAVSFDDASLRNYAVLEARGYLVVNSKD